MRRRDAQKAEPNAGHLALAELERKMGKRFYLCTQNVDDLHERAGSKRVLHMHGELFQSRCVVCEAPFEDRQTYEDKMPECEECGAAIRPHIVWFGEVPLGMETIQEKLKRATVMLVAGTSGSVYPAAGFVDIARQHGIRTVYVGPERPLNAASFDEVLLGTATEVLPRLVSEPST